MMKTMRTASQNTRFDKWLDAIGSQVNAAGDALANNVDITKHAEDAQSPLAEVAEYLLSRGARLYGVLP